MVPALLTVWAALVLIFDIEGHKLLPLPVNVQHGPAGVGLTFSQQCQSADLVSFFSQMDYRNSYQCSNPPQAYQSPVYFSFLNDCT